MRNPQGYSTWTDRESGVVTRECDTYTCGHCSRIVHVKPKQRPEDMGGLCKSCMTLICPACLEHGCTPFMKKIEQEEARAIALRSYGVI